MHEQNNKPNFDFIMNQPGSELETPKRSKKPLVFIVVAVVMLAGLTIAGLSITKKSTNIQPQSPASKSVEFLGYVANNNSESAYNMYSTSSKPPDKVFFENSFVKLFSQHFDANQCTQQADKTIQQDNTIALTYRCPSKKNPSSGYMDLTFLYQFDNSQYNLTAVQTSGVNS